jgi:hypothetical protein
MKNERLKKVIVLLLQCTWGLPQTLVGLMIYIVCRIRKCRSFRLGGAICTEWRRSDGISLGLFIFCPENGRIHLHEYGHTIQSLMLGPFYPLAVSLPSLLWAGLPQFEKMRREKHIPYSQLYCEKWADRIGAKYIMKRTSADPPVLERKIPPKKEDGPKPEVK